MKQSILDLLLFARQQEQKLVDSLSDTERNARGTPDAWLAKDFLANIMHWKELQTQKLAAVCRGEVPPIWKDMEVVHHINSQTFTHYHGYTFEEIQQKAGQVFHAFVAQVEKMSEEELNEPGHYAWQEGERLRNEILQHGVWYPCDQLTTFSLQQGHRQFAFDLQEALLEAVRKSALPAEGIGITIYNLACFYARNGEFEKAILLLPEALQLRPPLIEWAKHDSDLDGLRANPAFQSIFADPRLVSLAPVSELVSPQDLNASISAEGSPFVIDVRGSAEYASGHVSGSVNIPLGQIESRLKEIPSDQPIVTYCNMHQRGVSRGEQAAAQLNKQGYQARVLDGGYPSWKEQGFPVEESSPAENLRV
jgi:rhodanese-related sulfurtransferase